MYYTVRLSEQDIRLLTLALSKARFGWETDPEKRFPTLLKRSGELGYYLDTLVEDTKMIDLARELDGIEYEERR